MPEDPASGAVVELEIPARPEFVGIARMAVAAFAAARPGFTDEKIEDLNIVVSEACSSVIESFAATDPDDADGDRPGLYLRCEDDDRGLEIRIAAPVGAGDAAFGSSRSDAAPRAAEDGFRICLIAALVDEVEERPARGGTELRLMIRHDTGGG